MEAFGTLASNSRDYVATFVAGRGAAIDEEILTRLAQDAGMAESRRDWLAPQTACDMFCAGDADARNLARARLHAALAKECIDVVVQPVAGRRKRLLVADMDSTMIEQECIDELADMVGLRPRISAITERAMAGELVFEEALQARVKLLAGVRLAQIDALVARITLTPGARELVQTMRAHGAYTAMATGGFTQFTQPLAARIGFDQTFANRLEMDGDRLTGVVLKPIQGRAGKRAALVELRDARRLPHDATLAIGDGANDLDMLREAGLGVAYHAKPKVAEAASARVDHADLTALLYAQGYRREEFVN